MLIHTIDSILFVPEGYTIYVHTTANRIIECLKMSGGLIWHVHVDQSPRQSQFTITLQSREN